MCGIFVNADIKKRSHLDIKIEKRILTNNITICHNDAKR